MCVVRRCKAMRYALCAQCDVNAVSFSHLKANTHLPGTHLPNRFGIYIVIEQQARTCTMNISRFFSFHFSFHFISFCFQFCFHSYLYVGSFIYIYCILFAARFIWYPNLQSTSTDKIVLGLAYVQIQKFCKKYFRSQNVPHTAECSPFLPSSSTKVNSEMSESEFAVTFYVHWSLQNQIDEATHFLFHPIVV